MNKKSMKVFISHSSEDNTIAKKMAKIFRDLGIDYWVDFEQVEDNKSITLEIEDALDNCTHFLLLWSKASHSSRWVKEERQLAILGKRNEQLKKIVFKLDEIDLPLGFSVLYHNIDTDNV